MKSVAILENAWYLKRYKLRKDGHLFMQPIFNEP